MLFNQTQKTPQQILTKAIEIYQPTTLISLFSGGYDSMVATHLLVESLDTHGLSVKIRSIDTMLSADGWRDFVTSTARLLGWSDFEIVSKQKGFDQFCEYVRLTGCPRSRKAHTWVYRRLKERAIDAIHMQHKVNKSDKTLFVSGLRRVESVARKNKPEITRVGNSNKVFVSPIIHWSNERVGHYRLRHQLPVNPFYDTVKGSGDCQCNWGNFITLGLLRKYSPILAAGNVAKVDQLSRRLHGYGWDGRVDGQMEMFVDDLTTPFLCTDCSRGQPSNDSREWRLLQQGI